VEFRTRRGICARLPSEGRAFRWMFGLTHCGTIACISESSWTPQMTHVVTESCIRCKYTDCVDVCPVDCFREGPNFLAIDPDECIDCAVCIPECPVNAIYPEEDVPADQQKFIAMNAELAKSWPSITRMKPHPADADQWKDVKEKLQFLKR
jgi:ferredoxin